MTNIKLLKNIVSEGLIFNIFEHSFEENCPITAVNALHFLPCDFSNQTKFSENIAK